ncbi:hypothetical protein CDL12_20106 [Handroanthus impetiginosus]|uniref:Non-specific serine/threonine protein kinase n=1 Tax=Handroanthus impetiginosus TaxID=429701 RepID=A0A2G9GPU9_9LAMI|nr:hypothetical protein CDL12_20106 [Handroanthus impetiginosus]
MGYSFLQYGVVFFVALSAILGHSGGRDLRPSDHGLAYQEDSLPPAQKGDAQEMRSFFGSTTPSSSSVQLPEAKNISDTWWSAHAEGRSRDIGRDHVRLGLLVASAICGLTGIILLAVSGVVFLFRLQKRNKEAEEIPSTSAPTFVAHGENEK